MGHAGAVVLLVVAPCIELHDNLSGISIILDLVTVSVRDVGPQRVSPTARCLGRVDGSIEGRHYLRQSGGGVGVTDGSVSIVVRRYAHTNAGGMLRTIECRSVQSKLNHVGIFSFFACLVNDSHLTAFAEEYGTNPSPRTRNNRLLNPRATLHEHNLVALVEEDSITRNGLGSQHVHTVNDNLAAGLN